MNNQEDIKILITDDSMVSRKSIIKLLKQTEYKLYQASSGKDAIHFVEKGNFDLVLLDLLMPDMTGVEVLQYFKKNNITVPVIVISADIQVATKELCFENGAVDFLNKPPVSDLLLSTIEKVLNKTKEG